MEVSERVYGNRYFIFAVALTLIAYLMWVLAERLDKEFVNAEKAAFELRVAEMKAAVLLMEANLVARNSMAEAESFVGTNPMLLMADAEGGVPAHYAGEKRLESLSKTDLNALAGSWIFEVDQKAMIYFPRSKDAWDVSDSELSESSLKFSVIGLRSEEGKGKAIHALRLEPVK